MAKLFGSIQEYDLWLYATTFFITYFKAMAYYVVIIVKRLFKSPKNITGQVVLITGAGRGLGREIALKLGSEGCHVAIVDVNLETAQRTAEEVERLGVKAKAYYVSPSEVCLLP